MAGGDRNFFCRVLKGPGGVQGEGVLLGKPKDSGREDWGTLGKIRGITTPLKNPIIFEESKKVYFTNKSRGAFLDIPMAHKTALFYYLNHF